MIALNQLGTFKNGLNFNAESVSVIGYDIIGIPDFGDNYIAPKDKLKKVDANIVSDDYLLMDNDILFVRSNGNKALVGRTMIVSNIENPTTFSGFCIRFRPNTDKVDPLYMLYLFKSPIFRRYFSNNQQTSITNLNQDVLGSILIDLPTLYTQKTIVKVIHSLTRRIENNNQVNDNLEQVIKSCFDFMFATKNPNGIINDILCEHPKSTIQVNDSVGVSGDYPFFTSGETVNEWQTALVDGMNCYLSTGGNATIKGYYGKAAYSTDTWCVFGKGEYSFYLYSYLKSIIRSINDSFFAGSGLKHLQKDSLVLVKLYIPTEDELKKFNLVVKPAMETMAKLFIETKKLKQQRDFLLPLLMNGQATIAE